MTLGRRKTQFIRVFPMALPVGHQVGSHHLYDYLEEGGYSPLDAGRSSMPDLSSDSTPHHYDFRSLEDSCNYFDRYLCSPLSEIGGDHPENCCFGLMIVLPVPSCNLPNDYIRRCNRCTDHGTGRTIIKPKQQFSG